MIIVSLRSNPSSVMNVPASMISGSVRYLWDVFCNAYGLECSQIDHQRFSPVRAGSSSAEISISPSPFGLGIQWRGGRTSVIITGCMRWKCS